MAMLGSHSGMSSAGASSATPSVSDLDAYNFRDYHFPQNTNYPSAQDDDEFGFDPPVKQSNDYTVLSPPNEYSSQWPEFEREEDLKPSKERPVNLDAFEMDKFMASTLPNTKTASSRFGQMTPPRSHSASSTETKEETSPKSLPTDARKQRKPRTKEVDTNSETATKTTSSGRKRKSTRKSMVTDEAEVAPGDQKRKQSLEKNRLAAAKCRVNKKEKTERLQRDSHDKAVENAYLKDQVMRMKDEIQQMNAVLVAHANCKGCKSPEEIQAHLNALGNDFFNQQLALAGQNFGDFQHMNFAGLPGLPDNFFSGSGSEHMLHPPLPEFNRTAEFEVHTPMAID